MEKNLEALRNRMLMSLKSAAGTNFGVSFLFPVLKNVITVDAAFLYTVGTNSARRTRPFAMIVIDPQTGSLLKYQNAYFEDFMNPEEYPMNLQVDYSVPSAQTAKEQGALIKKVNELYEGVRGIAWKDAYTKEEEKLFAEYKESFYKAVPVGLLPFYEALSPEFFAKLKER